MARKEPENFYRRQQEEANRIATKQYRALVDIAKLVKSSNEELRKMQRAFEAFAEAVNDMKIEPFKLQAFTAALAEAERTVKIAEWEHPPPLFDVKAFKEALGRGEAPVVPEGEPYPEVKIEPDHSKKRVEAHAERAPRLGFGDVVDSPDERTTPPLMVVDEAEEGGLRWRHKLSDEAAERLEEVMGEGEGNSLPEEECADVSEARRTPRGYAVGGYTGVSHWATEEEQERLGEGPSKFGAPISQLAGIVHPGELWGTAEQLQRMRNQGSPDDLLIVVLDAAKPGEAIQLRRADLNKVTPAYVLDDPADGKGGLAVAADAERQRRDGLASY